MELFQWHYPKFKIEVGILAQFRVKISSESDKSVVKEVNLSTLGLRYCQNRMAVTAANTEL